jgi:hypothetical protein
VLVMPCLVIHPAMVLVQVLLRLPLKAPTEAGHTGGTQATQTPTEGDRPRTTTIQSLQARV